MKKTLMILGMLLFTTSVMQAQFYIGAFGGFKASGLKGAIKISEGGQVSVGSVADASSSGFAAGITTGYQVIPYDVTGGLYKLDINLDASWSNFSYLEEGWNSIYGAGQYTANGLSDGSTNVLSFDIMPIHRFNFSNFILSPFAGLGLGINLISTSDVTTGPPSVTGTLTGASGTNIGLLFFYGTLFNLSDVIKPFIQFKHMIPFGDETQLTETLQSAQGGGSSSYAVYISDVPGYFNINAGVRFVF